MKKKIIEAINKLSGKYSAYEVYSDWIRMMAMSISNGCTMHRGKIFEERERIYVETASRYNQEELLMMCEMTAWLIETLENEPNDVLGSVYMESGMGSKAAGQFFTPFHLSWLCSRLSINTEELKKNDEILTINEPSCGGGGMIIAAAKTLYDAGINYQKRMKVVAQDLDWKGVYMCYVQLSLLGINALCVQGNTLSEPFDIKRTDPSHILCTPRYMGILI